MKINSVSLRYRNICRRFKTKFKVKFMICMILFVICIQKRTSNLYKINFTFGKTFINRYFFAFFKSVYDDGEYCFLLRVFFEKYLCKVLGEK